MLRCPAASPRCCAPRCCASRCGAPSPGSRPPWISTTPPTRVTTCSATSSAGSSSSSTMAEFPTQARAIVIGGLRLACNEARWIELKRQATSARSFGLEMQLLTPREAQQLWPLMYISDLVGAAFLPTDGQVNPSDITQSLARGARLRGVRIFEDTNVLGIELERGRVRAISTDRGRVQCEVVVNCAGQWACQVC